MKCERIRPNYLEDFPEDVEAGFKDLEGCFITSVKPRDVQACSFSERYVTIEDFRIKGHSKPEKLITFDLDSENTSLFSVYLTKKEHIENLEGWTIKNAGYKKIKESGVFEYAITMNLERKRSYLETRMINFYQIYVNG